MSEDEEQYDDEIGEDEVSEEEDNYRQSRAQKKPRKQSMFVELEAEDSSAEEDEDDDGGDLDADDLLDDRPEAGGLNDGGLDAVHRRSRQQPGADMLDGMTEEEMEQHFQDRYQRNTYAEDGFDESNDINPLPSVNDPKLFSIPCRGGQEQQTVIAIMQKAVNCEAQQEALKIKSAFYQPSIKGFIYVEAEKEDYARKAVMGMRSLFYYKMKLVPIGEMVEVLTASMKACSIKRNGWVRIKRGKYKGDLAQIVEPDEAQSQAQVRLLPRIDLQAIQARAAGESAQLKRKRGKIIPTKRLFTYDEVVAAGGQVENKYDQQFLQHIYVMGGEKYVNGYLIKTIKLDGLMLDNVQPSIEEIQDFETSSKRDGGDMDGLAGVENVEKRKLVYLKGDVIRVIEGDLKNLQGEVLEVDAEEEMATIKPYSDVGVTALNIPFSQIVKHFNIGDHIKVIAGRYDGETGMIVKVDNEMQQAIVFSDLNKKELKVFLVDVQKSNEVATGLDSLGNYQLHDLVSLGPQAVGVITRVDRNAFSVINNSGVVQEVKVHAIGQKKNSRNAVALDGNQNQLTVGDLVKVADGKMGPKMKTGKVLHLFRSFAFLYNQDLVKNAGVFVIRARQCVLLGGQSRAGQMMQSGYGGGDVMRTPDLRSPAHGMGGGKGGGMKGGAKGGGMKGGKGMRNDHLVNRKMMITRGPYKGYEGLVKEATDTVARVELQSKMKIVPVNVSDLKDMDTAGRGMFGPGANTGGGGGGLDMRPPATPSYAPQTPTHHDPMATPSRSGDDPRWSDAWDPDASAGPTPHSTGGPSPAVPGYSPGGFQSHSPYPMSGASPGMQSGSDAGGFQSSRAPQTPDLGTPNYGASPATFLPGQTPTAYGAGATPKTTGTPYEMGGFDGATPHDVATPGGMDSGISDIGAWLVYAQNVVVQISGGAYLGREGTVQSALQSGENTVTVNIDGEEVQIPIADVQRMAPGKKDDIKVVSGQQAGETGVLIGIDGEDGIVKMDTNSDIKILDLESLCKCAT